ncbi:MAG: hypothetical protein HKN10_20245 [Myxococcales bacterium]|nr:hypothetical protein [Deltaproteobacteria bacterium]NNE20807.1 hypothetical protein [Myxococcales bacterium]
MNMNMGYLVSIFALLLALAGCERGAPSPKAGEHDHAKHHHDHAAEQAAAPGEAQGPVGPRIETASFVLAVAPSAGGYRIGKTGEVEIALEGRGDWHVNEEYPIRVDLKAAPGVALAKTELLKDDAKEFGEERVRFLAGLEPSAAGDHEVTCDVSFAMCTEENCILEKRTVAMQLKVE